MKENNRDQFYTECDIEIAIGVGIAAALVVFFWRSGLDIQGASHIAIEAISQLANNTVEKLASIDMHNPQGLIKSLESKLNIPGGVDFFTHPIWHGVIDFFKQNSSTDNVISNAVRNIFPPEFR